MTITIGELIDMPLLTIRLRAGGQGVGRLVSWAHTCELANPWDWLGPGDLLMSNGLGIPPDHDQQTAFVENLDAAGLSGILIGEGQRAPPLTEAMFSTADRLRFPLMLHPFEVPFVPVARAVADANAREEQARLVQTVRLYDLVRQGVMDGNRGPALIERLADACEARMFVVDPQRGSNLLPGLTGASDALLQELAEGVAERGGKVPSVIRLPADVPMAWAVPVPASEPAVLIAETSSETPPSLALLQHVAMIVALELEKLAADREVDRRLGAELFAALIDGRIDLASAQQRLREHGFTSAPVVVATCRAGADSERWIHHRLIDRGISNVLVKRGGTLHLLVPAAPHAVSGVVAELDGSGPIGTSATVHSLAHIADGVREACWALEAAERGELGSAQYGDGAPLFMPRTISEAHTAVARVLGDLIQYDVERGTDLLGSLSAFLEHNRSWQRTAKALMVHKQTVVYRMRRVEELTGLSLSSTADVAQLWLAIQAERQVNQHTAR